MKKLAQVCCSYLCRRVISIRRSHLCLIALPMFVVGNLNGQIIGDLFARMKSPDEAVRHAAQADAGAVLDKALPHIDREIPAIKAGLFDSDAYVRSQAAALLSFLAYTPMFGDKYADIPKDCLPDLVLAADDKDPAVANKALRAIAAMPNGPPASTFPLLERALASSDNERKGLAVIGLTKSPDYTAEIGSQISAQLRSATEPSVKMALLGGIMPAGSDEVAETAATFLYDPDPEGQELAIRAMPNIYKDRSRAKLRLQEYVNSPKANPALKGKAEDSLKTQDTR